MVGMPVEIPPSGVPLSELVPDARTLGVVAFAQKYGHAFFLRLGGADNASFRPTDTGGGHDHAMPTGDTVFYVLPVVKRRASTLAFVSVGRLQGNDIAIADTSVSKLHASVREKDHSFTIVDEGSRNGTTVDGKPVASRETGPPTVLSSRCSVRFGSIHTTFLNAADLIELARRLAKSREGSASPAAPRPG